MNYFTLNKGTLVVSRTKKVLTFTVGGNVHVYSIDKYLGHKKESNGKVTAVMFMIEQPCVADMSASNLLKPSKGKNNDYVTSFNSIDVDGWAASIMIEAEN